MAIVAFLVLIHLFQGNLPAEKPLPQENECVKLEVTLADTCVRPGKLGTILVTFAPIEGIHINANPAVEMTLGHNDVFALYGESEMTVNKENGFLSTRTPVKQQFLVSSEAKPGEYTLKGTLVYYFCSDDEGWCRKFTQSIALTLHVGEG